MIRDSLNCNIYLIKIDIMHWLNIFKKKEIISKKKKHHMHVVHIAGIQSYNCNFM